jgi:guanylate kinase
VRPFLIVLSSPSGGGKSTIARHLLNAREDLGYSVSATTRLPRAGEVDGVDYHFLAAAEFDRRIAAGEFVEWAVYGGCKYGTLRSEVERVMAAGQHVVLDIEVAGARQVRKAFPESVGSTTTSSSTTTW